MTPLLYTTAVMIAAIQQSTQPSRFLKNRYFPTDETYDLFSTEEVLMDIQDGSKRMAPVVIPKKRAITVDRDGFRTDRITPPYVAPQRILSVDELSKRTAGEAFLGSLTPEKREAILLAKDIEEMLEMHVRREEYIAAQCMLNNGYTLRQYADDYGTTGEDYDIQFYNGEDNPAVYTPSEPWNGSNPTRYQDMGIMVRMLTRQGKRVSDAIMSPDVMDDLLNDETVYKLLDNRSMNLGSILLEEVPDGAAYYGTLSIAGRKINLFTYDEEYTDEDGVSKPLLPPGTLIFTAPEAGRGMYGGIIQIEDDKKPHSYAGARIPKYIVDSQTEVRSIRIASRPLLVPRYANPWVSANVFA